MFNDKYHQKKLILDGYFEDYTNYIMHLKIINSWFPEVEQRNDNDLIFHFRGGDRLVLLDKNFQIPKPEDYKRAIETFNFDNLYVISEMPVWDYISVQEFENMKFNVEVPSHLRSQSNKSVDYFNSIIDMTKKYNIIFNHLSVDRDFSFMRSFNNILLEHGTLSWWAAVLSKAQRVGVYGPWRPFKNNNKNLSKIPLDNWFQWE